MFNILSEVDKLFVKAMKKEWKTAKAVDNMTEEQLIERESHEFCLCTKPVYAGDWDEGFYCQRCSHDIDPKDHDKAAMSFNGMDEDMTNDAYNEQMMEQNLDQQEQEKAQP